MKDVLLRTASGKAFYNTSKFTFERLLDEPEMMTMVMDMVGGVLYERLKKTPV